MDNKTRVLEVMKKTGVALKSAEIVDLTGLDKNEVDKAMKELKKEESIVSPKRCYWEAR